MSNDILLALEGISKSFDKPSGEGKLVILDRLCLEVPRACAISVIGKSGSGKSTMLQIAGLLENPTEGRVILNGSICSSLSENRKAELRNTHMGFIFQSNLLLEDFNAIENVMVPALIAGKSFSRSRQRALDLLSKVDLKDRLEHYPRELSGGEKQRIAICRALMNEPELILADEPTGSLDEANASICESLLLDLAREEGKTLLLVTHNMDFANKAQAVYRLLHGRLERIAE
ncbi:MAG: ABC transporter ATP-binding protein [Sphaerochaetaceae bacterium]|jgi:lipoprotein-releasing system ATP-binding protein|nr:ABC transporter ATP-binding protein [Sphaerochaetaceae bacterium]